MANNEWEDDYDEEPTGSDLVKKLRNDLKRALKERDEVMKTQAELQRKVRQTDVKSFLNKVGAPSKMARYILQDVEDPTEDAVRTWLDENGEDFGYTPGEAETDAKPDEPAAPPTGMSVDEAAALAAINQFSAPRADGSNPLLGEVQKKIDSASNADELIELLKINHTNAF